MPSERQIGLLDYLYSGSDIVVQNGRLDRNSLSSEMQAYKVESGLGQRVEDVLASSATCRYGILGLTSNE